jgi:predicted metal-dependent phosphoesterase TrpH
LSFCDFHVHSTASDGRLSPLELVNEAVSSGLCGLALTDHDTLAGVPEASQRALELGLFYIPAVELSVDLHIGGSAHLLGYFPGMSAAALLDPETEFQKTLESVINGRNTRNPAIVERFVELGFDITMEDVMAEAGEAVVGRPHIAAVMVKKGYAGSTEEVFDKYLGSGKPAYVQRTRLGDYKAIHIISQSGGLPVLAHPVYIQTDGIKGLEALICSLADAGLAGLEAFYPEHDARMIKFLKKTAAKRNLFLTGGSDFHGIRHPLPEWGTGSFGVRTEDVRQFMEVCQSMERRSNGKTQ